eukprot:Clim_evm27s88 gene=Clim_evmTU27s88
MPASESEHTTEVKWPHNDKLYSDKELEHLISLLDHNEELKKEKLYDENSWLRDRNHLARFLIANDGDAKHALGQAIEAARWQQSYKPHDIKVEDVIHHAQSGKQYRLGFDRQGRPCVYMRPRLDDSTDTDGKMALVIYTMEKALKSIAPGSDQQLYQVNWIIDMQDWHSGGGGGLTDARNVAKVLGTYYPERLHRAYLINAPWLFHTFFRMIKVFLAKRTAEKAVFVSGKKGKVFEQLTQWIDPSQLESDFGGEIDSTWDNEAFIKREKENDILPSVVWNA